MPLTFILPLETIVPLVATLPFMQKFPELTVIAPSVLEPAKRVYGYFSPVSATAGRVGSIEVAIAATTMPDKSLFDF